MLRPVYQINKPGSQRHLQHKQNQPNKHKALFIRNSRTILIRILCMLFTDEVPFYKSKSVLHKLKSERNKPRTIFDKIYLHEKNYTTLIRTSLFV